MRISIIVVCLFLAGLFGTFPANASTLPFGFPSVSRVLETVHGKNKLDTEAREVGTVDQLIAMLATAEGPRQFRPSQQSSAERDLRRDYVSAENQIVGTVHKELAAKPHTLWEHWTEARYAYSEDTAYVVNTFLSAKAKSAYARADAREKDIEAAAKKSLTVLLNQNTESTDSSGDPVIMGLLMGFGIVFIAFLLLAMMVRISGGSGNTDSSWQTTPTSSRPDHNIFSTTQERNRCGRCHGSGKEDCHQSQCRGGLWYDGGTAFNSYCPSCHGTGKITCGACNGSGYV